MTRAMPSARDPTRYHAGATYDENPQTAEVVTAVTGAHIPIAGRAHAHARTCAENCHGGVTTVTTQGDHFQSGPRTLSDKRYLVTLMNDETNIDNRRIARETLETGGKDLRRYAR